MAEVGSVDVELEVMVRLRAFLGNEAVVRDELDNDLLNELPTVQGPGVRRRRRRNSVGPGVRRH
jgi:hypothetical protein